MSDNNTLAEETEKENKVDNNNNNSNDDVVSNSATILETTSTAGDSRSSTTKKKIGDYDVEYLIERAEKKIAKRISDWEILKDMIDLPALDVKEIEVGRFLGEGGFFKVHEIQKITLLDSIGEDDDDDDGSEAGGGEMEQLQSMIVSKRLLSEDTAGMAVVQNRWYMQKHCCRPSKVKGQLDCRYAIKTMKRGVLSDPGLFVNTLVDMAIEAKFLASLKHPNIIKMRGISKDFVHAGANSFIIVDRLYELLVDRLVSWKSKKENSFGFVFDFRGKKTKAFLAERLTVGFDIANALAYLHDRK